MKQKARRLTNAPGLLPASLLLVVVTLMAVSAAYQTSESTLHKTYGALQKFPWQAQSHVNLAAEYIARGNETAARQELLLARIQPHWPFSPDVLGEISEISKLEQEITQTSAELSKREEYWQQIVADNPAYKDGWIQLAYIASLQKQAEKAMEYTQKIQQLDPNFGISTTGHEE